MLEPAARHAVSKELTNLVFCHHREMNGLVLRLGSDILLFIADLLFSNEINDLGVDDLFYFLPWYDLPLVG